MTAQTVLPYLSCRSIIWFNKLIDVFNGNKNFLLENKKEIITIIFENNGSNEQLKKAIDSSGLNNYTYVHTGGYCNKPTLKTLVDSNQRMVLFNEHDKLPAINYIMYAWGKFSTRLILLKV